MEVGICVEIEIKGGVTNRDTGFHKREGGFRGSFL